MGTRTPSLPGPCAAVLSWVGPRCLPHVRTQQAVWLSAAPFLQCVAPTVAPAGGWHASFCVSKGLCVTWAELHVSGSLTAVADLAACRPVVMAVCRDRLTDFCKPEALKQARWDRSVGSLFGCRAV